MAVLRVENLSKSYGAFDVFTGLEFSVARGDKIALVGANGCGKSTLLRVLAGVEQPNPGGHVHRARGARFGYLAQTAEEADARTPWQLACNAFENLNSLRARMMQIEQTLAQPNLDAARAEALLDAYGALQQAFEQQGGYLIETRTRQVLHGLGLDETAWHRPMHALSGGQRVRANLAHLLLASPDVLLLDEPTNHLDAQAVEWLERFLQAWEGTLIVVSHDRYFLDEVCDHVWEMTRSAEGGARLAFYRGGYTEFVQQRAERQARAQAEYEAQQAYIAKQEEYIRRNLAGQNSAQARGRLRRLNRLERLERPVQQRMLRLQWSSAGRSGDRVLETRGLVVGYERALLQMPDLVLTRGERVAVIGPNGAGKTSLLKTLIGQVRPFAGEVRWGAGVRVGYFAQAHEDLDPNQTLVEALLHSCPDLSLGEARAWLGRFLFSGDDHSKRVAMLSGGERGRLALARLALQGANVLLLDEPTNHLDIPAQEALTEALQRFEGTLVFVSHDRYLIAALASQLWVVTPRAGVAPAEVQVFKGAYDEWREAQEHADSELASVRQSAKPAPAMGANKPRLSKNALQRRQAELEAVMQRIQALEAQLDELSQQMQHAGSDFARLRALGEAYRQTEAALAEAWAAFERLS